MSRHLNLTEEEREKLDGSYKVARKLEKLQAKRLDQQMNSLGGNGDDILDGNESPCVDSESRSLDSHGSSEKTSPETSLIGSNGKSFSFANRPDLLPVSISLSYLFLIGFQVVPCHPFDPLIRVLA